MHRRALLSAGLTGLAATAGCLGPGFGSGCTRGTDFRLQTTSDADTADAASDPLETLSPPERTAVDDARRGAHPTLWVPDTGSEPFEDADYVATGGAYLTVETSIVETVQRTGYDISLDYDAEATVPADARRVAFADLPAVDRAALFAALGYPNTRELDRFDRARAISIGGTLAYPDDEAEARSELVPDPNYDYVRIRGSEFRLQVTDTRTVTMERRRIETRTVAESVADFAAHVHERRGIDLDEHDLSAAQREIIESAIEDGYDECAPYSEPYADLQRLFGRQVTRVTDDGDGVVSTPGEDAPEEIDYANYENQWYAVSMSEYVA
ncbi:hypothetical protein [Haloplanus halobius]|uniref:hypothetical protein n=1 Tax=Haloplanus halobius TaxID=2934938 RepID=UPI00200CEB73|nr:hypothetical protein [Haloplanus sp. XH21]